jgi:hypothetical protein
MNAGIRVCQECGADLTTDSPHGLCPRCLLKLGLGSQAPGSSSTDEEKTVVDPHPAKAAKAAAGVLPREGQQFGEYHLLRLLGQGGMGTVYEAEHVPSERRMALKVLNHSPDSPEARKRFLREGQLAASINHANTVYVFGTEEIDGIPVISMELASGGTLKDVVRKRGPLPITEAVDVMMQVIAGLEAAQAKGVLHRDIKPSNCFVDANGTVKVGDFGLSISSLGRGGSHLTVSGSLLGTPAFASPEQIRGDELDVRSDIYSVGVTLYFLLTGRTPFESENMARLLAMVIEKSPDSPLKLRSEITPGLAKVVLRCLGKRPSDRFKDYGELGRALRPFGSVAVTPATQGWRMAAFGIDILVCYWGWSLLAWVWPMVDATLYPVTFAGTTYDLLNLHLLWLLLYFAITEGIWGFSMGKRICGLRAVRLDRGVPGVSRAFLRAVIFFSSTWLPCVLALVFNHPPLTGDSIFGRLIGGLMASSLVDLAWLAFLFSGANASNEFQGLHDRFTQTRVIRLPGSKERPLFQAHDEPAAIMEPAQRIGPYSVLGPLPASGLVLGYDDRLLRKVWICTLPDGTPPLPLHLRTLNRAGRLRWLNGKRSNNESWDAYEALSGRPLLHGLEERTAWKSVRWWLHDLAEEFRAASQDRSVPAVLNLDRIWITVEGRAKLLDFPAPGTGQQGRAGDATLDETKTMAETCDRGTPRAASSSPTSPCEEPAGNGETSKDRPPLPYPLLHPMKEREKSRSLMQPFGAPSEILRTNLFLRQVALSALEGRRLTLAEAEHRVIGTPLPLPARSLLDALQNMDGELPAAMVRSLGEKPAFVTFPKRLGLLAGTGFLTLLSLGGGLIEWMAGRDSLTEVLEKCSVASLMVIVPSAILALVIRDGFLWRHLEVAVVTKDGAVASRLRLFWRTLVSWSPILLSFGILNFQLLEVPVSTWPVCALLAVFFGGAVWALLKPNRGPQDWIAGTWLVPR